MMALKIGQINSAVRGVTMEAPVYCARTLELIKVIDLLPDWVPVFLSGQNVLIRVHPTRGGRVIVGKDGVASEPRRVTFMPVQIKSRIGDRTAFVLLTDDTEAARDLPATTTLTTLRSRDV